MELAHRVSLNGIQLDSLDSRIIIRGIEGGAGRETVTTAATGAGDGTRITGQRRDSVELAVRFGINISARRDGMEERGAVLEAINAWAARGGILRVNYKPNRRLTVDEVVLPGEGDLWRRTSEYTILFRAHAVPYWEEDAAVTAETDPGLIRAGVIAVAGSARTQAEAELINVSGALINDAAIAIGAKTMKFKNLGMAAGETLRIDHVIVQGKYVVRIRIGGRSVMAARSEDSADDFTVAPGECPYNFSAQRACRLRVSCRGRFA